MKGKTAVGYSFALIALLAGMILVGAIAISLIQSGEPAFKVAVFGAVDAKSTSEAALAIRPRDVSPLPRGVFDAAQLLPMPVIPVWKDTMRYDVNADPLYKAMASVGLQRELDRARADAQAGRIEQSSALYEKLQVRFPNERALLIEHASVLASAGRHAAAASLVRAHLPRHPRDYELTMLAARNLWWNTRAIEADSQIGVALALRPGDVEALRLRETIRATTQPDLATAQRWARESSGTREQLLLARAYTKDQRYAEALRPYRLVMSSAASDSLLLEIASAAAAADSLQLLEESSRLYHSRHPSDPAPLVRLARAYSWRADFARSATLYDEALALGDDPAVRLEKANVLMWSGREKDAERELLQLAIQQPTNPEIQKLLGDLASYRADWARAARYYRGAYAIDPAYPAITGLITQADQNERLANLAATGALAADAYQVGLDVYGDNQNFSWVAADVSRSFRSGPAALLVTAEHMVSRSRPAGALSINPGYGIDFDGSLRLNRHFALQVSGGANQYDAIGTFSRWGAGLNIYEFLGANMSIRYAHEPALRRVTNLVALQAATVVDALQVAVNGRAGRWNYSGQIESESFDSRIGGSNRLLGGARISHLLTDNLSADLSVSAVSSDDAAPILPGWGSLYWSPEHYLESGLGLTYSHQLTGAFSLQIGANGGYAWVRERQGDQRFGASSLPIAGGTVDLRFQSGRWNVGVGGSYGGALQQGYRAGRVRLTGSYQIGR